jgi:hypothetical protein
LLFLGLKFPFSCASLSVRTIISFSLIACRSFLRYDVLITFLYFPTDLERMYQRGSIDDYERIARKLYTIAGIQNQFPSSTTTDTTTYTAQQSYVPSRPTTSKDVYSSKMPSQPFASGRLMFKESPFYKILEPLSSTVECKGSLIVAHSRIHALLTMPFLSSRTNQRHCRAQIHPLVHHGAKAPRRPQLARHGVLRG